MRALLITLLFATSAQAEEIPLKSIWALSMPGTIDVQKLNPKVDLSKLSRQEATKALPTRRIVSVLSRHRPKEGEQAGPAFVVEGVGEEALKNAEAVLTKQRRDPPRYFPPDKELSLVFYAFSAYRVHIESIDKEEKQIVVKYRRIPHLDMKMTTHFALIPIGKLSEGTKYIKIEQLPPEDGTKLDLRRFVCDSSAFHIRP